jgi:hypothetical protein
MKETIHMNYPEMKHPPRLQHTSALVLERAKLTHPWIEGIRSDAIEHLKRERATLPGSVAVIADTAELKGLLEHHWKVHEIDASDVGEKTLVLCLPAIFNWAVREMAVQSPEVFNRPQLDLRNNQTYSGWAAILAGESEVTVVQVPDCGEMSVALTSAYRCETHEWGWMPVVMVAGDTVAVGGFVVDKMFLCGLQAASMSTTSCRPEEVYSDEELAAASGLAEIHGLKPWVSERWREDGSWILEPDVLIRVRK